jgi:pilus assembly protein CpaC
MTRSTDGHKNLIVQHYKLRLAAAIIAMAAHGAYAPGDTIRTPSPSVVTNRPLVVNPATALNTPIQFAPPLAGAITAVPGGKAAKQDNRVGPQQIILSPDQTSSVATGTPLLLARAPEPGNRLGSSPDKTKSSPAVTPARKAGAPDRAGIAPKNPPTLAPSANRPSAMLASDKSTGAFNASAPRRPKSSVTPVKMQSEYPLGATPPPPPPPDNFIESIDTRGKKVEHITVGKNSSVIISTKINVDAVQVTDPTVADVAITSPTRIIVTGKSFGTTQLVLRAAAEERIFSVSCELDTSVLDGLVKSVSPSADVRPRSVNGNIVLTGTVPDAQTAERIGEIANMVQGGEAKNQLNVAGVQQTMLRVVVAEVNKDAMRRLGVNWAIGGADWTRDFFAANNIGQLNPTVISSAGVANVVASNSMGGQQLYNIAGVGNGPNTNFTFGFPRAELQFFLNALRENNLSRILAEPNLVAISGQTATFLAGGEVPIPVTQGGAVAGAIVIEYKEFGVRLAFTPTVLEGQMIRIHVMSEFSDAIPGAAVIGGLPVFTFTTRRVESTVECGNGQTFAVAGLLSERVQALASKIPGLGDIPVLGTMFSSTEYRKNNTELVILVTPQLVEPMDPQQVAPPPGSLMTDPNDFELFTLQQLEGTPLPRPQPDGVPRERYPVSSRPLSEGAWTTSQLALVGPWGLADAGEE